jgi:hypothetical protein
MIEYEAGDPAPGTLAVGSLAVNMTGRRLFIGVPPTVSSDEQILLLDSDALDAELATKVSSSDLTTGLATKADTSHTHAISDVTGLSAALAAAATPQIPPGVIVMWSGALGSVPAGWALCDGTNGTPNLINRFVVGAGDLYVVGNSGGTNLKTQDTGIGGAHNHGGATSGTILSVGQLPAHAHAITDAGHVHGINDPGHVHQMATGGATVNGGAVAQPVLTTPAGPTGQATTGITIRTATTGIVVQNTGSGEAHTHPIPTESAHSHPVTVDVRPPYFALAYIMKLA